MKKSFRRFAAAVCGAVLLFCNSLTLSAFAEVRLPEGTVAGLPEKLTVMDSDGNSASSDTGEYFFYVEDMQELTEYSKDIQIINLREDKAYHIYLYAEPISSEGEIDLVNECSAVFSLNGEKKFEGKVTGESADGSANLSEEPIDLGIYKPGESGKLNCTVTWNGTDAGGFIDEGSRLVDREGTHILREKSGDDTIEGKVTFRWIFCAAVDEDYVPPNTGTFLSNSWGYIAVIAAAAVMVIVMAVLVRRKKKKKAAQSAQ
jgi:hypothetical protein